MEAKLIGPVARERIAGKTTIRLQGDFGLFIESIWVEPVTYRAVQERLTVERAGSQQQTALKRFRWLPATAGNLKKLRLVVPPGVTHE